MCLWMLLVCHLLHVRAAEICSISSVFHQKQRTWHYYYLYVNSNKAYVGFDIGHDLSEFL